MKVQISREERLVNRLFYTQSKARGLARDKEALDAIRATITEAVDLETHRIKALLGATRRQAVSLGAHMAAVDAVLDRAVPCADFEVTRSDRVRRLESERDAAWAEVATLRAALAEATREMERQRTDFSVNKDAWRQHYERAAERLAAETEVQRRNWFAEHLNHERDDAVAEATRTERERCEDIAKKIRAKYVAYLDTATLGCDQHQHRREASVCAEIAAAIRGTK